ncbi:MAG TPA: VOC family protein [Acidobacteriota bacterium]|nr:VOC family protein [Acidobacteriota bacterium]
MPMFPFHLAFPVTNLEATRSFYADLLGCQVGREAERWIDFDLFGHQISAHLADSVVGKVASNDVDSKQVPIPHFGVILDWDTFHRLADRLQTARIEFIIEPYIRFQGEVGEQATMFFQDPSGNYLEFKAFKDMASIFAR